MPGTFLPSWRLLVAFVLFLLLSFVAEAQPQWEWVVGGVGTGQWDNVLGTSLAADGQGSIYVAGKFSGTATFAAPAASLTSAGDADAFLVKYGSQGNVVWAIRLGGTGYDTANGVAVDAAGFVYLAGRYWGPVTMGSTTLTNLAAGFLARIDPANGNVLWARDAGLEWFGVAVDANSNAYVVGQPQGLQLIGLRLAGPIALAKYNSTGVRQWYTNSIAPNLNTSGSGRAIAVDGVGDVYITGIFKSVITFGSTSLSNAPAPNNSYEELFLAKFSTAGIPQWARSGGAPGANDQGLAVGVDGAGNAVLAGITDNTLQSTTLGGFAFPTPATGGSASLTLARFTTSGAALWARKIDGISSAAGLCVSSDGSFVATGYFRPIPCDFGGISLTKDWVNEEVYVVGYDAAGTALWGRRTSSTLPGVRSGVAVAYGPDAAVYNLGSYTGASPAIFDGTTLNSVSTRTSLYLGRLTQTVSAQPALLGLSWSATGLLRLAVNGSAGQTYVTEAANDLRSWGPISTNTLNGGVLEVTDPAALGANARFYRLRIP